MSTKGPDVGRFSTILATDLDHEEVYVEIYLDGKFVALINQENGVDDKVIEFPGPDVSEDLVCREVGLDDFMKMLEVAARRLEGD